MRQRVGGLLLSQEAQGRFKVEAFQARVHRCPHPICQGPTLPVTDFKDTCEAMHSSALQLSPLLIQL